MVENNKKCSFITDTEESEDIKRRLNKENMQIIKVGKSKTKLCKNNNIFIIIDIENNKLNMRKLIKSVQKLKRKCDKKEIKIGLQENDKNIVGKVIGLEDNIELKKDVIECLEVIFIESKKERIEYIYDKVCDKIDEEFRKNNYCDFKNDVCIAKRSDKCKENITMGCCHKFTNQITMSGKLELCPYFDLNKKQCTTKCITCKLFTCDYIKRKFKIKEILLINCFYNKIQKLIVKSCFFTEKETIFKRLLYF